MDPRWESRHSLIDRLFLTTQMQGDHGNEPIQTGWLFLHQCQLQREQQQSRFHHTEDNCTGFTQPLHHAGVLRYNRTEECERARRRVHPLNQIRKRCPKLSGVESHTF